MKLITFLGTGNYQETNYFWEKDASEKLEYKTKFFPEALANWLKPEKVLVLLTEEAENHNNWKELKSLLETKFNYTPFVVNIPSGSNETELWQIFSRLTKYIEQSDELVFDITHGFRSLPLLSLLAISYLRVAKNINVEYLLYGAFDARDKNNNLSPTFNLTEFVNLLDWITATDQFVKTGDSSQIGKLIKIPHDNQLENLKNLPVEQKIEGKKTLAKSLKELGNILDTLSKSLLLVRPIEISKNVERLEKNLNDEKAKIEAELSAKPILVLFDRIQQEYKNFENTDLTTQLKLIEWYINHNHISQAVSLGREWLISWASEALGLKPWHNYLAKDHRSLIEDGINNYYHWKKEKKKKKEEGKSFVKPILMIEQINNIDKTDAFYKAWSTIDLRNDLMHCGMRPDPLKVENIFEQARNFVTFLKECNSSL
ncbi:MAG: TIGR02221 family CRISPR-associated protein [Acidobacteria bacterium]|nr:TIGR02221 family CRISPR-associated protein [Acidobacteriota bacterium]